MEQRGASLFGTRIRDEKVLRDSGIHHDKDLFDENGGRRDIDESTGAPWDDTGGIGADEDLTVQSEVHCKDDGVGDVADRWLKANDPNYKGH